MLRRKREKISALGGKRGKGSQQGKGGKHLREGKGSQQGKGGQGTIPKGRKSGSRPVMSAA